MGKVRRGDTVRVLTGKDRKKEGEVLKICRSKNRALVKGINLVTKHVKPNPQKNITGGRVLVEAFIDLSNLKKKEE